MKWGGQCRPPSSVIIHDGVRQGSDSSHVLFPIDIAHIALRHCLNVVCKDDQSEPLYICLATIILS